MIEIVIMLLLIACALAIQNWRQGFALCVLTALAQDPLRKLFPDQPVYFVVLVGVVFLATWVGAVASRVPLSPNKIVGWRQYVGTPFMCFAALALLQAAHSLVRFGNPAMTGIGLTSYLAPIPAIVLAYRFALSRGESGVLGWMRFYVIATTLALTTVYLEYAGVKWPVLGEVGGGMLITDAGGEYKGNAGIFRATEIAAWHAATVACFGFILVWGRRFSLLKVLLALAFIGFLLGIGALTGRRKMIIEVAIFLSAYVCLISWFRRGSARIAILAAIVGVVSYTVALGSMAPDHGDGQYVAERLAQDSGDTFGKYSERAQTVFADVPKRALELGIQPVSWAVSSYGWLGAGLGVGSQGAQHFGAESSGAAEGGLGKLTVEMGIPGLALASWLILSFFRYVRRLLELLSEVSPRHANIAYGIVAFILANVAAFSVATQAYADIFILLTLGWAFGFLVSLPVLADLERRRRETQASAKLQMLPGGGPVLHARTKPHVSH